MVWFFVLIIGVLVVVIVLFIIYVVKKLLWVDLNSIFELFYWEI